MRQPHAKASSTDPTTWASFEDAVEAYSTIDVDGIGVVLTRGAHITCIDLDRVIAPDGQLDPRAARIVGLCDSWTEKSPSGTGTHTYILGTVPDAVKGDQIEIYADARYIAVTGHRWPGTPDTLRDRQAYLDLLARLARQKDRPRRPGVGPATPPPDDLAGALLAKLQAWGVPVARLKRWQGGFLVELDACPWADEHTTGTGGAAVIIHASGAFDFTCLHAHCAGRTWRDFRAVMEQGS